MKLHLRINYGGARTNEQRIPPGDYDADDERLFGLAGYLVDNGHAVWVDAPTLDASELPAPEPDAPALATLSHEEAMARMGRAEPEPEAPTYAEMTIAALMALCEARGIDLSAVKGSGAQGRLLKEDYIAVLEGDDRDGASEAS